MKRVAILQSNYIPWKGYFDLINFADEFIIYDDMQFTKRDWRNRNFIKTHQGKLRLTVPVNTKGQYYQTIYESKISGTDWTSRHWKSICMNYTHTPFFDEISEILSPIYLEENHTYLSSLNYKLITTICNYLNINTVISSSKKYDICDGKTERLVDICKQANATSYMSGNAARSYIVPELFSKEEIDLQWMSYEEYPEYPQLWGDFIHEVSIIDLLFNCGKQSKNYMKSFK